MYLNNRNFISLAIGSFVSGIGDHLYNFALTVWLYKTSGSITSVAIMWFARAFLRIPVQYISGILADKYNKKYIAILTNLVSAPLAFSLIYTNNNLYLAYLVVFLLQAIDDIDVAAEVALLPEVVEKDKLEDYNSAFSVLSTITLLISPALGGLLYRLTSVHYLFLINSISFLIAAAAFNFIKYTKMINENKSDRTSLIKSGLDGFLVVKQRPIFILLFMSVMSLSILGRFYEIFKVYIADSVLNIGAEGILYFSYAMALGGFLTPFIMKKSKKLFKDNLTLSFSSFACIATVSYFVWGCAKNIYISFCALFVLGIFSSCYLIAMTTIIQKETPQEFIGRVFACYKISLIFSALLGIIISPYSLKFIGTFWSFLIFSIISLICLFFIIYNDRKINGREIVKTEI